MAVNLYYEVEPSAMKVYGLEQYYERTNVDLSKAIINLNRVTPGGVRIHLLTSLSSRIWCEEEGTVRFVKHRGLDIDVVTVDLQEFMWIKLKSQSVK